MCKLLLMPYHRNWVCILCKQWPYEKRGRGRETQHPNTTWWFGKNKKTRVTVCGYCDYDIRREYWKYEDDQRFHVELNSRPRVPGYWIELDRRETERKETAYTHFYQQKIKNHFLAKLSLLGLVEWDLQ